MPVDVLVYTPRETESWSARFRQEVERGMRLYALSEGLTCPPWDLASA